MKEKDERENFAKTNTVFMRNHLLNPFPYLKVGKPQVEMKKLMEAEKEPEEIRKIIEESEN